MAQSIFSMNLVIALVALAFAAGVYSELPPLTGQPLAEAQQIVVLGNTRFTILTSRVIRIENDPDAAFEDSPTVAVWNRQLRAVPFSHDMTGSVHVITTQDLVLTFDTDSRYNGTITPDNLAIKILTPSYANPAGNNTWHAFDPDTGNLYGTFHTLDGSNGWQEMNCSRIAPWHGDGPSHHCVMGLISTQGWAILDDSRSPLMTNGWFQPQTKGRCTAPKEPCFPEPSANPTDQATCERAGCCYNLDPRVPVTLYYSDVRHDHFSSANNCQGCDNHYVQEREQGSLHTAPFPGAVKLSLFWSSSANDNVLAVDLPAGDYSFVNVVGYLYPANAPAPANTVLVKLWYHSTNQDHFTTMGHDDEAEAQRMGYTLLNASLGYAMNVTGPAAPLCGKKQDHIDWYFFGHGADYKAALSDYAALGGAIPLPRRHFLGMSWSKWENIVDQAGVLNQLLSLKGIGAPVDTYIFDMQWHLKPGWTGYTWDPQQFPDHVTLLRQIHDMGLATAANLHDASGVGAFEKRYPAMAAAMGIDPSTNATIPFTPEDIRYMDALHEQVLDPLQDEGMDWWWTDWQQGLIGVSNVSGLNPTIALNHYRFWRCRKGALEPRGLTHSRYGGLGNHRYATGFGGDVVQNWNSLEFMLYFTQTASNVLFGWWGHEMMADSHLDQELFTRVIQFGAWSPTYTNWGNNNSNDNLWELVEPYRSSVVDVLVTRSQLLPYRYTAGRIAHDTGVSSLRPMYYDWPMETAAYSANQQYMFGPDLLVSPVNRSMGTSTSLIKTTWLPSDTTWFRFNTTELGSEQANASIHDVPVFAKLGSIIATRPRADAAQFGSAARAYNALELLVHDPWTSGNGSTWVYEDDGWSNAYLEDVYANTRMQYNASQDGSFVIEWQRGGGFNDDITKQDIAFHLLTSNAGFRDCSKLGVEFDHQDLKADCSDALRNKFCCYDDRVVISLVRTDVADSHLVTMGPAHVAQMV
eukprot:TRINITY_DN8821_c0_g1_i3.p1 TRINITY_DN8821_c0_g1~~TRINITY_DN8821_c0_g1_i3.p1  ORF type:complete len:974 (+),score=222.76 TRINITY_DN8821_c0_g1_i3:82-3003(+)